MLLRGITRNLEKIFSGQGAQTPVNADIRTPLQAVQIADDVRGLSTPPEVPRGWVSCTPAVPAAANHAGAMIHAPPGGAHVSVGCDVGQAVILGTRRNGLPAAVALIALREAMYGPPRQSRIEGVELTAAQAALLPAIQAPFIGDPFHTIFVPSGDFLLAANDAAGLSIDIDFQIHEVP